MAKISDILKGYRKSVGSFSVKDSPLAKITGTLDTGCYAINRVISGNIYEGIPEGRIVDIYGESQSGKSWLASNIIKDALINKGYQRVFYFDSEGGALFDSLEKQGIDMDLIEHVPVHSTEDCKIKMVQLYDQLAEAAKEHYEKPSENEMPKVLCVLDSFGMLESDKVITDAEKDKVASDMGTNAKSKNSMMKVLAMRVVESNCTLIVINQIYRNPGAMFASKILEQPGGEGLKFASHVMLQMSKLLVKSADDEFLTGNEAIDTDGIDRGFYKGNRIRCFCAKNRVVKPCFEATMYLDFDYGISKYDGLIEDAVKFGFIQEVRGGYVVPSYKETRVTYKELVAKKEIWDTFIDKFNEESIKRMGYSNSTNEALAEIEKEIEEESK